MTGQPKNETIIKELQRLDDRQLVNQIINGDRKTAGYYLYNICYKYFIYIKNCRLQHLDIQTDDLISDFYIFLEKNNWEKLKSFRFESKLETWVNIVASRYLFKLYSKELKENSVLNSQIDDNYLNKITPSEDKMSRIELIEAINLLPNKRDRLILLFTLDGFETEDVAKRMGISTNNVYILRSRATKHLKEIILNDK